MLGVHLLLPFLVAIVGALFDMRVNGPDAWFSGAVVGFGVGCAIVAVVWLLFALLKRWADY
jgi:hypothetical protein